MEDLLATDLQPSVPQRASEGDCLVAAFATATGRTYEEIADAFGIDPERNEGQGGVTALETVEPMLKLGFAVIILAIQDADPCLAGHRLPTAADADRWLQGRNAVLLVREDGPFQHHALAWRDGRLFDGRSGEITVDRHFDLAAVLLIQPLRET